jgi:cell division protein FtsI/penicillin-binding protein 2
VTDSESGETVKHTLTNALFVSVYAPNSVPELTVSVVIEKATSGTYASLTAARIFGVWEDMKE